MKWCFKRKKTYNIEFRFLIYPKLKKTSNISCVFFAREKGKDYYSSKNTVWKV